MHKCTTEQFWAVASLTAADGFVIQSDKVSSGIALVAITIATIYGVFFIFDRHFAFYRNRKSMGSLFKDERDAPDILNRAESFYILLAVGRVILLALGRSRLRGRYSYPMRLAGSSAIAAIKNDFSAICVREGVRTIWIADAHRGDGKRFVCAPMKC